MVHATLEYAPSNMTTALQVLFHATKQQTENSLFDLLVAVDGRCQ
jgi:hypothetical protein